MGFCQPSFVFRISFSTFAPEKTFFKLRSLMDRMEDSGSFGWGSIPHGATISKT